MTETCPECGMAACYDGTYVHMDNCSIGMKDKIRDLKKQLKNKKEKRPWGSFEILADCKNFKVKKIVVNPKSRLSYQKHMKRDEHWYIVSGVAKVTINGTIYTLHETDGINIAIGSLHRIENKSSEDKVVFIEVQTGEYFGEDDIIRVEDDYGRMRSIPKSF